MKHKVALVLKALPEDDTEHGAFEAVLSAPTLDRDNEVIDEDAFLPLPETISIHKDHVMNTDGLIGSAVPSYEDGVLMVRGTFSSDPAAQRIRTLIKEGHLKTMSVGFLPRSGGKKLVEGVPHITKAELLEGSFVSVPSNRDALVVAAKAGARHSAKDASRIQALHDLVVELGVVCETTDEPAEEGEKSASTRLPQLPADFKTMAGSLEEQASQRSDALRSAVRDLYPESWYVWIRGTFADHVVCDLDLDEGEKTYEIPYSISDDGSVSLGEPKEVAVAEVAIPKSVNADPETAAAPAAASSPADAFADDLPAFVRASLAQLDI